jgi:hypothetical protein
MGLDRSGYRLSMRCAVNVKEFSTTIKWPPLKDNLVQRSDNSSNVQATRALQLASQDSPVESRIFQMAPNAFYYCTIVTFSSGFRRDSAAKDAQHSA